MSSQPARRALSSALSPARRAGETLYLISCDKHGRGLRGEPMVAGNGFMAQDGHPGLPWGCGAIAMIDPDAPRWLVVLPEKVEPQPGGARIFTGKVVYDGDRQGAIAFLVANGAGGLPHIGRERKAGDFAVMAAGALGTLRCGRHAVAAVGARGAIEGGESSVIAVDAEGRADVARMSNAVGAHKAQIKGDDMVTLALGLCGVAQLGDGAVVAAASQARVSAGAASRVLGGYATLISVGPHGIAVGEGSSRFKGGIGARLIALTTDAPSGVVMAVVDDAGIKQDIWYEVRDGKFEPCNPQPT